MSLLLRFLADDRRRPIAKLAFEDLTLDSVLGFLKHLEHERGNSPRTRNQRRAALNTFFSYLAVRVPDMLAVCQHIAAIPVKRTPLPDTHYLEREEMTALPTGLCKKKRIDIGFRMDFIVSAVRQVPIFCKYKIESGALGSTGEIMLAQKGCATDYCCRKSGQSCSGWLFREHLAILLRSHDGTILLQLLRNPY